MRDVEEKFNLTNRSANEEGEELKKRLTSLQQQARDMSEQIESNFDLNLKEIKKLNDEMTNANAYSKTVEIMLRTLSQRTYSDLGELHSVIDMVSKMLVEEKTNQVKETETLRKILSELNKKVDVELPEAINANVMKRLEEIKQDSIKIWELSLDYAQKIGKDKQQDLLKQNERLNNYTYAVGGRDSYGIPALGEIEKEPTEPDEEVDDSANAAAAKPKPTNKKKKAAPKPAEEEEEAEEEAEAEADEEAEEAEEEAEEEGEEEAEKEPPAKKKPVPAAAANKKKSTNK